MKSNLSERKNTLGGMISRLDEAEDQISELGEKIVKFI